MDNVKKEEIPVVKKPTQEQNMELWNAVEKTDPNFTKEVGFGRKFTSIDAQYQIREATKQWGSYGDRWKLDQLQHSWLPVEGWGMLAVGRATFKYPSSENHLKQASFDIHSTITIHSIGKDGKIRVDEDWAKKLETDMITKALSKVGFNADVFMGRFDDNKYVQERKQEVAANKEPEKLTKDKLDAMLKAIEGGNGEQVTKALPKYKITPAQQKKIDAAMDKSKATV